MRKWAYRQKNMYWRNLASGALELEDAIDYSKFFSFAPPDLLKIFPPAKVIDAMRVGWMPTRPPTPTSAVIYQLWAARPPPPTPSKPATSPSPATPPPPTTSHPLRPTIQGPHQTHRPLIGADGCWRQWQSAWQSTSQHQPALRRSHWIWQLT
jgi:hypothetical protein